MFQKKTNEVHNYEYEILDFTNGNSPVKIKMNVLFIIKKNIFQFLYLYDIYNLLTIQQYKNIFIFQK